MTGSLDLQKWYLGKNLQKKGIHSPLLLSTHTACVTIVPAGDDEEDPGAGAEDLPPPPPDPQSQALFPGEKYSVRDKMAEDDPERATLKAATGVPLHPEWPPTSFTLLDVDFHTLGQSPPFYLNIVVVDSSEAVQSKVRLSHQQPTYHVTFSSIRFKESLGPDSGGVQPPLSLKQW